jgi:hypothetical protein
MAEDHQAEYAQRIATVLNIGVLQDAVADRPSRTRVNFKSMVLDLLDALESAGLKLVVDDGGEVFGPRTGRWSNPAGSTPPERRHSVEMARRSTASTCPVT